jgi:membrane associated rhomboid family serine protease
VFRFPPLTPFVRVLLIALVASFVLGAILDNFMDAGVIRLFALNTTALSPFTALQVFTHTLVIPPLPGVVFQLLLSLLFLWWCLAPLEEQFGRARAIQLSLLGTVGAALPALAIGLVFPNFAGIVAGPGAITLAAIAAYVALLPGQAELNLGRFSIRARVILWLNIALSVVGFLTTKNAAQLGADLGAIGVGILFTRHVILAAPRRAAAARRGSNPRLRLVKKDDDDDEPKRWLN